MNELADNIVKAGASFAHCSGTPYHLHQEWYQDDNATADWAWLLDLSRFSNTQYGLPPVEGNVILFPKAKMPSVHALIRFLLA